jgi:hypothetical protein
MTEQSVSLPLPPHSPSQSALSFSTMNVESLPTEPSIVPVTPMNVMETCRHYSKSFDIDHRGFQIRLNSYDKSLK